MGEWESGRVWQEGEGGRGKGVWGGGERWGLEEKGGTLTKLNMDIHR